MFSFWTGEPNITQVSLPRWSILLFLEVLTLNLGLLLSFCQPTKKIICIRPNAEYLKNQVKNPFTPHYKTSKNIARKNFFQFFFRQKYSKRPWGQVCKSVFLLWYITNKFQKICYQIFQMDTHVTHFVPMLLPFIAMLSHNLKLSNTCRILEGTEINERTGAKWVKNSYLIHPRTLIRYL